MNVLLAEADVPYEQLQEMDQINPEFPATDVVLVLGANDVVNPQAKNDPNSPLYGMPVLDVQDARTVFVVKRGMSAGYSGIKTICSSWPTPRCCSAMPRRCSATFWWNSRIWDWARSDGPRRG